MTIGRRPNYPPPSLWGVEQPGQPSPISIDRVRSAAPVTSPGLNTHTDVIVIARKSTATLDYPDIDSFWSNNTMFVSFKLTVVENFSF